MVILSQKIRRLLAAKSIGILVGFCLPLLAVAQTNYFLPSTDYYSESPVRFSMMVLEPGKTASSVPVTNLGGALSFNGTLADGTGALDKKRGYVTLFGQNGQSTQLSHVYPANFSESASLSFWMKPDPTTTNGFFILSKGNATSGASVYVDASGRLNYTAWCAETGDDKCSATLGNFVFNLRAATPVKRGAWTNVIITHHFTDDTNTKVEDYAAIYVDGVLEAKENASQGGGILTLQSDSGIIGSALTAGKVQYNSATRGFPETSKIASYSRTSASTALIGGQIEPFFTGAISEFRYFGGTQLWCSSLAISPADYAKKTYVTVNLEMEVGSRCAYQSDIRALSADRIEQRAYLARLPLRSAMDDINYSHTGAPNSVISSQTRAPTFVSDDLRLSAASFLATANSGAGNVIAYSGGTSKPNLIGPFSFSLWFKLNGTLASDKVGTLLHYGSSTGRGLIVYMYGGKIYAGSWLDSDHVSWVVSSSTISDQYWHHLAVSFDASPSAASMSPTPYGTVVYLDGSPFAVGPGFRVDANNTTTTNIGAVGTAGTLYDPSTPSSARTATSPFGGVISEVQVLGAPLTLPQVVQRANRFPRAYRPATPASAYGQTNTTRNEDGYVYEDSSSYDVFGRNPSPGYQYDAVQLVVNFNFGSGSSASRWKDQVTGQETDDCEYVMGGVSISTPETPAGIVPELDLWTTHDPRGVNLCFSPGKISDGLSPFTMAMWYPNLGTVIYVPLYENLLPPAALNTLKNYGTTPIHDLSTTFKITIAEYNILIEATTLALNEYYQEPNYISVLFFGAKNLVETVFSTKATKLPATFVYALGPATGFESYYMDQKMLFDEIDANYSKDR